MLPMASRRSDVADKDEDTRTDPLLDGAKAAAELIAAAATTAIAAAFMVPDLWPWFLCVRRLEYGVRLALCRLTSLKLESSSEWSKWREEAAADYEHEP